MTIKRPADLIVLTGDTGAEVGVAHSVEIPALQRRVDCVIELERSGEKYYRHLEYESEPAPDMAKRCFQYNTQLTLLYGVPVLTTVVYLFPPSPATLVYQVRLGGRTINRWRFEVIRLWQQDAAALLESAPPGVLALLPLMRGRSFERLARAAARIQEACPDDEVPLQALLGLAGGSYTMAELMRIVPKEALMRNSIWEAALAEGKAEGRAEGEAKGRLEEVRTVCREVLREYHPELADRAEPLVAACDDLTRLHSWIVKVPVLDSRAVIRLIGIE